jgi:hypothetical protein
LIGARYKGKKPFLKLILNYFKKNFGPYLVDSENSEKETTKNWGKRIYLTSLTVDSVKLSKSI